MDQKTAARNARFVYVIEFFENSFWTLPIWVLFFTRQLGFSLQLATIVSMSRWISQAIFNVPTGAWADRVGRAKLYKYGQLGYALSFAPLIFTNKLYILLPCQIIGGLFGSMTVGVLRPMVQESFRQSKMLGNEYKHFVSNTTIFSYAGRLLSGIVGAWLYVRYPYAPYFLLVPSLSVSWVLVFFVKEPTINKDPEISNNKHIKDAVMYLKSHRLLKLFMYGVVIKVIATESIWAAFQPYFVARNIPVALFGFMFGAVAVASMLGAYLARRLSHEVNGLKVFVFMCAGSLVSASLMSLRIAAFAYFVVLLAGFAFGFSDPVNHYVIQREVDVKYQSTVLSLRSFLYTGAFAVASIFIGFFVDHYGVQGMLNMLVIQSITCVAIISYLYFLSVKKVKL